ncbi:unnamed protein product [Adineta steineri]|uniref:dihydrofolate reductase n=2 Tax=Adineta steineri TaxID=433720 RepID=A0A815E4I0_9BILA|nr:unnamed protein product [Adineta steineri]
MKFCGCLTVEKESRDENSKKKYVKRYFLKRDLSSNNNNGSTMSIKSQKERTKSNTKTEIVSNIKKHTSTNQSSLESIDKVVRSDNRHDTSKRRSVTFANDSETEQRKFLRLNQVKRGSIDELQFHENKRAKSSPNVNNFVTKMNTSYETTTGDELDTSQQKKSVIRRRKRSKSPRKQLPSELLDAIKFDLVESGGLDDNQLKIIPYENIKTSSQPMRISISSYSSRQQTRRRRCSSPFNRAVVHSASSHVLHYPAQPSIVCIAQVKSTMDIKPFMNIVVAMDENNTIGHNGKVPWAPLLTDHYWFLTHSTTTKDPLKRIALILGRKTFIDTITFFKKYVPRWHFIVLTQELPEIFYEKYSNIDRNQTDVVNSIDEAAYRAKKLIDTPDSMIESVYVFGGVIPYEQALERDYVKRIYLTRVFAKVPDCDTQVSKFDLNNFQRIKRPSDELLAEYDDKTIEENGWTYQFQVYDRKNT